MLLSDAPSFLTCDQLVAELAKYTYRAGLDLSIFQDRWEGPCLYIRMDVPDGYNPGQIVELRIRVAIPPIPSPEYFAIWLQWRLIQVESHESREFFQRDGKPVFDPHDAIEPGGHAGPKPYVREIRGSRD